jgi:LuxR family maltose regulon positive regulatory protein
MERWLRTLPPELLASRPLLSCALAAHCAFSFRVAEAEAILNNCRFGPGDNSAATRELQGWLLELRGWTARLRGEKERSAALLRQALEILPADSPIIRGGALINLGLVLEAAGDLAGAADAGSQAAREAQQSSQYTLWLRAMGEAGRCREIQGALNEAARLYHEAMERAREWSILHTLEAGMILAGLGRLSYRRNYLPAAAAYLAEGMERSHCAFAVTSPLSDVHCLFEMQRLQTARGNTAAAAALLQRLAESAGSMPGAGLDPVLALLRVRAEGAPAALAEDWLSGFEARALDPTLPPMPILESRIPDIRVLEILTWAQLRLAEGDTTPVVSRLERWLEAMVAQGRHGSALDLRALLATLYWEGGRREQAVAVLEPALALAEREGYVRVFVEAGAALIPVLRQAAAQGINPAFAGTLLAALGGADGVRVSPSRGGTPALIEPLSDRELEVLRLVAAGLRGAEIATQLFVSEGTVRRHLHNLYGKLGANGATSAVARGRALSLV